MFNHGSRISIQRHSQIVQKMQQVEAVEDNRSRRRNGRKNLHAHHLYDQAVSYGIRAHRIRQLCREHNYGWSRVQHVSVGHCRPRRLRKTSAIVLS